MKKSITLIIITLVILFAKPVYAYERPAMSSNAENGKIYTDRADLSFYAVNCTGGMYINYRCYFTDASGLCVCMEDNLTRHEGNEAIFLRSYIVEGIYDIEFYCEDLYGARSDCISISFAVDSGAPQITFSGADEGNIYKGALDLCIEAKEMFYDLMTVVIDGKVSYDGEETVLEIPYAIQAPVNRNIYKFEGSGSYEINVTATDGSGHVSEKQFCFAIDDDAPEICVVNNGGEISGKTAVSNSADFTVDVTDLICDSITADIMLARKTGNTYTLINTFRFENKAEIHKKISLGAEGFYTLKVEATDSVGNKTERMVNITLDKSPPVIEYLSQFNEKYLNSFTMPENFKKYIIDLTDTVYKAYLNSKLFPGGEVVNDGKYILQVLAEDEAGNCSEEMIAFIIDNVNPKIVVNGLDSDGTAKDGMINLTLLDSDDYFESLTINGESIQFDKSRKELNIDLKPYDTYDISVVAKDLTGNETVETFRAKNAMSGGNIGGISKEVKTLTKNNTGNRGLFSWINSGAGFWIFCGITFITAVIFIVIAVIDIRNIT